MATIPNPGKSRTWDLGTSANGTFFDTEFNQLYANDNDLDGRVQAIESSGLTAQLSDTQAQNTAGGTSSGSFTYDTRNLNTEDYDPSNIVTISGNKFTPIAGTYEISVRATSYQLGYNRLKLRNVTSSSDVYKGVSEYIGGGNDAQAWNVLSTKFNANGTDEFSVMHGCINAKVSGYGLPVNETSTSERYMIIHLRKVG